MQVVVPFAVDEPKTRLASVLDPDERAAFARAMLADVLAAIRATGREPTVLATASLSVDAPVVVDDRSLDDAVNAVLEARDVRAASESKEGEAAAPDPDAPVAIVMADLALATPAALESLFSTDGDVVVAPGRGGGTNAFVSRHPDFRVDYHGASYLDHRRIARRIDATWRTVDSYRLSTDVDEPDDLVEVVLHGGERSRSFLEEAGFDLETSDGRVRVARDSEAESDGRQ